jgi:hypothetical protein
MILEARLVNILRVAFDAGLVLHRDNNRRRLLRQAGVMLEGVPRGDRNDLGPSNESFANVAVDTMDAFRAMMERRQVLRRSGCISTGVAIKVLGLRLRMAGYAKMVILLLGRHKSNASYECHNYGKRTQGEETPAEDRAKHTYRLGRLEIQQDRMHI